MSIAISHIKRFSPANVDDSGRAVAEIRRRWIRATLPEHSYRVSGYCVDAITEAALDAMLVRDFRVTPFPPDDEYAQLYERVRHWVRRARPIRVMLGYAPMKNPRAAGETHAEWAEFFALCHLCAWHNKVCTVYPPGLRIKIIFDDSTIRMANRYSRLPMRDYMQSIERMIPAMGYCSFIAGTMRQSSFAWLFHFGLYQLARRRVRRWERDPANAELVARMLQFAERNLVLPPDLSEDERAQAYGDASHRYRVYWQALQMSGLSRLGKKLVAMYLDGHQHHIRQFAAFHLRSVGKQQGTQPWQGEGALVDNGAGQLVPVVVTSKRRQELHLQRERLPAILPLPGFDSILVGRNRIAANSGPGSSISAPISEN
jgi:hypothetical protein